MEQITNINFVIESPDVSTFNRNWIFYGAYIAFIIYV